MLAVASCLWIWGTNQRGQPFSSHDRRISFFDSSHPLSKLYPPALSSWKVLHRCLRKGKIPRPMCAHTQVPGVPFQQCSQGPILNADHTGWNHPLLRLNYIPYISGASWIGVFLGWFFVVGLYFFFFFQLLQFLEGCSSTGLSGYCCQGV